MNRRDFFKKSLFSFGVFVLSQANLVRAHAAEAVKAIKGKLGYVEVSKFAQKVCENCKNFDVESGECKLVAMQKAMNAEKVLVEKGGYCNMWAKSV